MQRRLRRVRTVTLSALALNACTALFLPAIGFRYERSVPGAIGILLFCAAQAYVLHALVTPWADRRRPAVLFLIASVVSLPLVAPMGERWPSWSWLAACMVGVIPVLLPHPWRWVVVTVVVAVAVVLAPDVWWRTVMITGGFGLGLAAVNALQLWFWDLLLQAEQGRAAQSRLAAAEERLRFARDIHDLLGHRLSVIALKAELAERLTPVEAARARSEAAQVREIAASALTELRDVVHGYRTVDLAEQLAAIEQILRSSGVRCTVSMPDPVPSAAAPLLVAVLREATTNLLRHSRATWCTVDVTVLSTDVRMVVVNDGTPKSGNADPRSSGLRGLADRLAEAGGTIRAGRTGDTFTVEAVIRSEA